jgi:glycosyltransferase involved in cell wall biosynthesis
LHIAVVHDWLIAKGGAENVLQALTEIYPNAPVYTLVYDARGPCGEFLADRQVVTSFLQRFPQSTLRYRSFLPLMPLAIEQFDLSPYEIVISSSHAVAKGILTHPDQLHVCYCYTPIRYAWDLQHQYLRQSGLEHGAKGWLAKGILHYIRLWDTRTSNGVDAFIAISRFIAQRIRKIYRREAKVIYPPVDVERFAPCAEKQEYYFTAGRMVPYKRVDLIVKAFAHMPHRKLVVIGDGPEYAKIQADVPPNVTLLGYQPWEVLHEKMRQAKAFIFAAEEDFGILPVEAQACGTPVIAYGKGGALETVIEGKTGLFFKEQTVESIIEAIEQFENSPTDFSMDELVANAKRFAKERFKTEIENFINQQWQKFKREKTL